MADSARVDASLAYMRVLAKELGRTPTFDEYRVLRPKATYNEETLSRLYSGWWSFVSAAGLCPIKRDKDLFMCQCGQPVHRRVTVAYHAGPTMLVLCQSCYALEMSE